MDKTLTILIGPQGSGKTFYCQKQNVVTPSNANITPGRMVRISQDDQGKMAHFNLFLECLEKGHSMIIDRINHLREQRNRYVELARLKGYKIHFVWFDVDYQICLNRLAKRDNHPTIDQNDYHEFILNHYFREFQKIEDFEYDELTVITRRKHAKILDLRKIINNNKFIVIGDIHGCFDEFCEILDKCKYRLGDFVISVGDLMDRGPKSRQVIEWFNRSIPNAYSVEGNHDNKARRYWAGNKVKVLHGLDSTIDQCKNMDTESIAKWIESWPQIIQLPDINEKPTYVVHAGIDGSVPIDRQAIETCLYARYFGGSGFLDSSGEIWYTTLDGSYNVISGHMIQSDPHPLDHVFLIDNGAYQGGELRAIVVEDGAYRIEAVQSKCYKSEEEKLPQDPVAARNELVDQRLLRCDDKGDLRIFTYTDSCVHSSSWNDVTLNSRGIILNTITGEIVGRPFSKFFNMGEREETMEKNLPWSDDYLVFEKMDGWLGTLYRDNGEYFIATRGSFDGMGMGSWATEYLRKHNLNGLPDEVTLVFELICPYTHIIVDYGQREDLILLAAFNRHTGEEYQWDQVTQWANKFGFSLPRVFGSSIEECRSLLEVHDGSELEGFVIKFANGLRVKIKSEDYKRRAAIISNLTPLAIWKAMKNGDINPEYCKDIDADYLDQFNELVDALKNKYRNLSFEISEEYIQVSAGLDDKTRKTFALKVQALNLQHPKMMFSLLDDRDDQIDKYIMRQIRPDFNILEGIG